MHMRLILISTLLSATLALGSAAAAVYKWVDDHGVVNYGEAPPPGSNAQLIGKTHVRPPSDAERALEELADMQEQAEALRKERAEAEAKRIAEEQRAELQAQNCRIATQNLEQLRITSTRRYRDAEGNVTVVDDEARAARIQKAEEQIAKFCSN